MIEKIIHQEKILSIIIRNSYKKTGITFFTPDDFSQQLAYMNHPKGKVIQPHRHSSLPREVFYTQEVLFLKKGRLRVNFYDENDEYIDNRELAAGDVILLASGGHGFEVLEEIEMIEVKQGPYTGDEDKIRF
jgi:mannose-6-phosphate isomerase-like protein (cupin superfamily)